MEPTIDVSPADIGKTVEAVKTFLAQLPPSMVGSSRFTPPIFLKKLGKTDLIHKRISLSNNMALNLITNNLNVKDSNDLSQPWINIKCLDIERNQEMSLSFHSSLNALGGDLLPYLIGRGAKKGDLVGFKWDEKNYQLLMWIQEYENGDAIEDKEENQKIDTAYTDKMKKVICDLLVSVSTSEREEARRIVREKSSRLGQILLNRSFQSLIWEDGQVVKDINALHRELLEEKKRVEEHQTSLQEQQCGEDFLVQNEIYECRLASITRKIEEALDAKFRYEQEKENLIREMKRLQDEDHSRFNKFAVLHHRYILLNLLGKGGFSEVYKAFDLTEVKFVACKMHDLDPSWNEEKKQNYRRHAIRENDIHRTLDHRNIVRFLDSFEIDENSFCTVMEFCGGKNLSAALRSSKVFPENEARVIIHQIFQGLVHLNTRPQKIIHFDLKPDNVLFDEMGVVKLIDFGLSKVLENESQALELSSLGAGTYWYLPPECFQFDPTPLVSSKVDVWSAGVLLYQILYGIRPFGHDQTQQQILREGTILRSTSVDFPPTPQVSEQGKEFICRCLTYSQAERPDVLEVAQDPYLRLSDAAV